MAINIDTTTEVVALITTAGTVIGSVIAFMMTRHKTKADSDTIKAKTAVDYQEALNKASQGLIDQLQEDRQSFLAVIEAQGEKIERLTQEVHQLRMLLVQNGIAVPTSLAG